jgi:catechol 2,3-dioxygenase-like lactoylglutathione lyase family enzyme
MRIVSATLTARDPQPLQDWYAQTLGVEQPLFVAGEDAVHHFAFHVAQLDGWQLELSDEHDFSAWDGARARYFRDPEGNVGELIARPRARAERSLAEVGLPVADVAAAVEQLASLGLGPHHGWNESFAPLGDDDGLLIVVREGRRWFPTDAASGVTAVQVTVETGTPGTVEVGAHRVVSI